MSNTIEQDLLIRYVQGRASEAEMTTIEVAMIAEPRFAEEVEAMAMLNSQIATNPRTLDVAAEQPRPDSPQRSWLADNLPWLGNPLVSAVSLSAAAALAVVVFLSPSQPNQPAAQAVVAELSLIRARGGDDIVRFTVPPTGAVLLTFDAAGLSSPVNITLSEKETVSAVITDDLALAVISATMLQPGSHTVLLSDQNGNSLSYRFVVESP